MIGIEAHAIGKFKVYVEDPRVHRTVREAPFSGSEKQALATAIATAKEYLRGNGEQSEYEADWKCSDRKTMKSVPLA
jgi:hypothetical protein